MWNCTHCAKVYENELLVCPRCESDQRSYHPTQEDIRKECILLQRTWDDETEQVRISIPAWRRIPAQVTQSSEGHWRKPKGSESKKGG